jgi:hypothetical protein
MTTRILVLRSKQNSQCLLEIQHLVLRTCMLLHFSVRYNTQTLYTKRLLGAITYGISALQLLLLLMYGISALQLLLLLIKV